MVSLAEEVTVLDPDLISEICLMRNIIIYYLIDRASKIVADIDLLM